MEKTQIIYIACMGSHRKHQGEERTVGETFAWWFLQERVCKAGKAVFRLASWNDFSRL